MPSSTIRIMNEGIKTLKKDERNMQVIETARNFHFFNMYGASFKNVLKLELLNLKLNEFDAPLIFNSLHA